jgi:outer membrane protein OmpA-like peptidoglycan-associated protein
MLDDLELPNVQEISTYDRRILAEHKPPGMEGSLFQNMGRSPERIGLWGLALGPEALQFMQKLNDIFQAGKPVSFCADIVVKSNLDLVLIEDLQWEELAGKPEQAGYILSLREFISPVEPATVEPLQPEVPVPPVIEIIENKGTLIVEVVVEGRQDFDYGLVTVSVQGEQDDGISLSRTLTNRSENIWTEEDFPAGNYAVTAETSDPEPMTGTAEAKVSAGQTAQVTITLHPAPSNIAKTFVVHFKMDNAFIEPAMADVLKRVADYGKDHSHEKLIILGHTDLVGSDEYNQNLSERRARSAYAFLTFGRDDASRKEAIDEWDSLRKPDRGWKREINDNWGTREYQFMLQNLSNCYYYGNIDGEHGPKTSAAVSAFQKDNGIIPPSGVMTDETWRALIEKYLGRIPLTVPESQFFRNAREACDGGSLKWLGAGEQDPVRNTQDAWRPNRRTELLFVQGDRIPCEVPKPRTFDKLTPGGLWCLGRDQNLEPESGIKRQDFLSRQVEEPGKWLVQPAEPGNIRLEGVITKFSEDGPAIAHAKYVLTAPDGEYLHTDDEGRPDLGERPQGERRGEPIPDKANERGEFSYPEDTPEGTYVIEVLDQDDPGIARWERDNKGELDRSEAKGTIVFRQLEEIADETRTYGLMEGGSGGEGPLEQTKPPAVTKVVVTPINPAQRARPKIEINGLPLVVVTKSYTKPARREIILKTDCQTDEAWVLTSSNSTNDQIKWYTEAKDGTLIVFNGIDNEFPGSELFPNGKKLFAEGLKETIVDGYELALTQRTDPQNKETKTLTVLNLLLYLDTPALNEPPDTPPPEGTAMDKWYRGGGVHVDDTRIKLKVRVSPSPSSFSSKPGYADLKFILRQVMVKGNEIVQMSSGQEKAKLYDNLARTNGEMEKHNPLEFDPDANGEKQFFVEGVKKTVLRGIGYQLGIRLDANQWEFDGDRVALTVARFPRLVVALNESHVTPAPPLPANPDVTQISTLLQYIYERLKTPAASPDFRPDALKGAWESQEAEPLPVTLPSGQEGVAVAEEAWARQITEMLLLTDYNGPGQSYFNSDSRDVDLLRNRIVKNTDNPPDPVYGLTYACQHLSSFGVVTRVRTGHKFVNLLGAGSVSADVINNMKGYWVLGVNPPNRYSAPPATPAKLNASPALKGSESLFKIKDSFPGYEFAPGAAFVFANHQIQQDSKTADTEITHIKRDGQDVEVISKFNNRTNQWAKSECYYDPNSGFVKDNQCGAHIGFVLRTDPKCKRFQVFDTGALGVSGRGNGVTLFGSITPQLSSNFDDPHCNIVSGPSTTITPPPPFRGVGVWTTPQSVEPQNMSDYVEGVLKKARPLGFARLIIVKKDVTITQKNYNEFSNWLIYASPLLRMYEDDSSQNFAISRYIWSLRGADADDARIIWWIYIPTGKLAEAMLESRAKNVNQLALDAYNAMSSEEKKGVSLKKDKSSPQEPDIARILGKNTKVILEFQVPNDSQNGKVLVTYKLSPPKGALSYLHLAEKKDISDNKNPILLPMNKEFLKNKNEHVTLIPYFIEPPEPTKSNPGSTP